MRIDWHRRINGGLSALALLAWGAGMLAAAETASALQPRAGETGEASGAASPVNPVWWGNAEAQIRQSEYHVSAGERGLQAPNRANDMRTYFRDGGIEVVPRDGDGSASDAEPARDGDSAAELTWRTSRWGRWDRLAPVQPRVGEPQAAGARVVYTYDGLDEWYENGPAGLEQGFTVRERPEGGGPLVLLGRIGGKLRLKWDAEAGVVAFADEKGTDVLRYGGLHVWDASGRELSSHLELAGDEIAIVVGDDEAAYPLTIDPLLDAPAWAAGSGQDDAEFGMQCATAGDVNGDGYSDVIVSAPYFDAGEDNEGRIFLYLGSPAGLATTPAWTAESNQPGAELGHSLATAGDVNGDGYSDILAGTWLYDHGEDTAGAAFLYLGSAFGLETSPAWTVFGDVDGAAMGLSLSTAGDVNADGFSDVVIGALHIAGGEHYGYALVFHGSASGLGASPAWLKNITVPGEGAFGWSVSTAGDVNGDGFADVIIGSAAYDGPDGAAYVYHGSPSGLFTVHAWAVHAPHVQDNYGFSVATAGDVNGDGYADVMVGAEQVDNGQADEGRVYVYYGSGDGLSTSPFWWADGEQDGARFGTSVSTAGDVNGDGFADVLIGAMRYDDGETDEGRAFLYLGSPGGLEGSPAWMADGDQPHAYLGCSVATAGDVNGDGFSDLLVGAFGYGENDSYEGRALVFHGAPGNLSTSASWAGESDQTSAAFGTAVACAGDVNGDGYSDVVASSYGYDNGQTDEGRAFGYYGSYLGLPFSPNWAAESNQAGAWLGYRKGIASAGDVNGDGYDDVIAGAPLYDNGGQNEGRAWVFHGSPAGMFLTPAWTTGPNVADAAFGVSVASAGDVNGDGYADVIVGADPSFLNGSGIGRAFVFHGSPAGLAASPAWTVESEQDGSGFGASVASAGDVNGDGFSDVIVGAPRYNDAANDGGRAFVYLGSASGLAGTPAWWTGLDQDAAYFGSTVASAGDVNGDGFSDVIVGAEQLDAGQADEGRAFVYLGSPAGLGAAPAWTAESDQDGAGFQIAVAGAGDVNADGFSDVLVGFHAYDNGEGDEGIARMFLGSAAGLAAAPAWQVDSNQAGASLGFSVGSAGDVNADGFGDVIVSAINFDFGQTNEGRAYVYYGNERGGLERVPMQVRSDDAARIGVLGRSDSETAFRLRAYARTPAGRAGVSLEYEVKPRGVLFDGTGIITGQLIDTGEPHGGGSAVPLSELVSGLDAGTLYHWRARIVTRLPYFPRSPWFTLADNASQEADLRTGGATASVDGVEGLGASAPGRLLAPCLNPFRGAATFVYDLPQSGRARLTVHDVSGSRVALLRDGIQEGGRRSASWDGRDTGGTRLPAGVYFVRLEFDGRVETQKVVLAH